MTAHKHYGKCILRSDCQGKKCKANAYLLHGYSETEPKAQFDAIWFQSDDRKRFDCHLPLKACEYDIPCILKNLHDQIESHSDEPIDLVGMSLGGMIADAYAYEHPENINKLGLITSFSDFYPWVYWVQSIRDEPEHINNIGKYNWDAIKESETPFEVFEYNCIVDNLFVGFPPDKKGTKTTIHNDLFCFHGNIGLPDRMRRDLKQFMDGDG
jgi:pimeloyl-ACP methyl ester carboxylesterase